MIHIEQPHIHVQTSFEWPNQNPDGSLSTIETYSNKIFNVILQDTKIKDLEIFNGCPAAKPYVEFTINTTNPRFVLHKARMVKRKMNKLGLK